MLYYDLDALEKLSSKFGFAFLRTSVDALEISILDDAVLTFENWPKEQDTFIGFKTTPWHTHGEVILMFGDASYVELNELEVLKGIKSGDIVIKERFINGFLKDRWITHKDEKADSDCSELGEEIRIRRV
jgi:hypothetical protein